MAPPAPLLTRPCPPLCSARPGSPMARRGKATSAEVASPRPGGVPPVLTVSVVPCRPKHGTVCRAVPLNGPAFQTQPGPPFGSCQPGLLCVGPCRAWTVLGRPDLGLTRKNTARLSVLRSPTSQNTPSITLRTSDAALCKLASAKRAPPPRERFFHRTCTAMAANGEAGGEVKDIHTNDRIKTLLKNDALYEYMLNTMVYPREHECLRELRLITQEHTYGFISSPPDEVLLLSLLVKVMGARNTIEVGVFTGCSVLATALAIPDGGKVVAIDVSREYFNLGLPVIERAGVAHKVDFREGPAQSILDKLLADEGNEGKFDFAFVDADKGNYGNYHEQLLRLVRVGGVLAYDNTLWGGTVALPDDTPLTEHDREIRDSIRAFNAKIAADPRVEAVQLPIADGITLCRRVA